MSDRDEIRATLTQRYELNPEMKGWSIFQRYRQQAEQLLAERKASDEAAT
jgi:hypothetical protein